MNVPPAQRPVIVIFIASPPFNLEYRIVINETLSADIGVCS